VVVVAVVVPVAASPGVVGARISEARGALVGVAAAVEAYRVPGRAPPAAVQAAVTAAGGPSHAAARLQVQGSSAARCVPCRRQHSGSCRPDACCGPAASAPTRGPLGPPGHALQPASGQLGVGPAASAHVAGPLVALAHARLHQPGACAGGERQAAQQAASAGRLGATGPPRCTACTTQQDACSPASHAVQHQHSAAPAHAGSPRLLRAAHRRARAGPAGRQLPRGSPAAPALCRASSRLRPPAGAGQGGAGRRGGAGGAMSVRRCCWVIGSCDMYQSCRRPAARSAMQPCGNLPRDQDSGELVPGGQASKRQGAQAGDQLARGLATTHLHLIFTTSLPATAPDSGWQRLGGSLASRRRCTAAANSLPMPAVPVHAGQGWVKLNCA
jgi:hypothetical protein